MKIKIQYFSYLKGTIYYYLELVIERIQGINNGKRKKKKEIYLNLSKPPLC